MNWEEEILSNIKLMTITRKAVKLYEALKFLVALKDHKDECGKDVFYTSHQPDAWKAAKELLNEIENES